MILLVVECVDESHARQVASELAKEGLRTAPILLGHPRERVAGRFSPRTNGDPLEEMVDSHPQGQPPLNRRPPPQLVANLLRPCPLCGARAVPEGSHPDQMCQRCAQGYAQVQSMPVNPPAPPTPNAENIASRPDMQGGW